MNPNILIIAVHSVLSTATSKLPFPLNVFFIKKRVFNHIIFFINSVLIGEFMYQKRLLSKVYH